MVHALHETRRVLAPGGTLIDLRPLADAWPIEIISKGEFVEVGRVTDLPQGLADDAAANQALAAAEEASLFRQEAAASFPFHYTWDSPREMQTYLEDEWADFVAIGEDVWGNTRSAWALAEADARVGIRVKMMIARFVKGAPR